MTLLRAPEWELGAHAHTQVAKSKHAARRPTAAEHTRLAPWRPRKPGDWVRFRPAPPWWYSPLVVRRLPPSRQSWALAAAVVVLSSGAAARAVPPTGAAVRTATLSEASWTHHEVIPGERLGDIADRYGVRVGDLQRWNRMEDGAFLRVGRELRVRARSAPPPRARVTHVVRSGDSWNGIAAAYGIDGVRSVRRWNPDVERLRPGQELVLWVEGPEHEPAPEPERAELPRVHVAATATSVGRPDRGRIVGGMQLPPNEALYTIRNPSHAWASSHTITELQRAIAEFRRQTGFAREIVVADISREGGGRFRPHRSHTSGRDVDVRLPLALGVPSGTIPWRARDVDWDVAWDLVKSFVASGQVRYIFLARQRQRELWQAAKRAGATSEEIDEILQYPRHAQTAVVRHSKGHVKHIHVRFECADYETACADL